MIGLLGKKIGMTQIFDDSGRKIPVTVLEVGPCHVTDLRTPEKDGYTAVQLGFDTSAKEKNQSKPKLGQFKKAGVSPLRFIREIRTEETEGLQVGQTLKTNQFQVGDFVDIEGISKGQGFQGVVKRHGMKGAQTKSHGAKHGREIGSTGMSATPARVLKGTRLPGRMGNEVVTTQNIKVIKVDEENNLMAVKGAVPGAQGGYLVIRVALKKSDERKWKVQGSSEAAKGEEIQTQGGDEKSSKEEKPTPSKSTPEAAEAKQGSKPAEVSDSKS